MEPRRGQALPKLPEEAEDQENSRKLANGETVGFHDCLFLFFIVLF